MRNVLPIGSYTKRRVSLLLILVILLTIINPFVKPAHAAAMTEASIQLNRMGAGVAANNSTARILVVVEPTSTSANEAVLELQFPDITSNAFTVDTGADAITHTTTGIPSTYHGENMTAFPGMTGLATAADAGANSTVQFDIEDLNTGSGTTLYGFYITGGITNPTTGNAGTKILYIYTKTAANVSATDTGEVAVDTVTTGSDQVTLTATVPPTFNFALSGNSIALGTLSTSAQTSGNVTVDIDTNGNNGWIAWIRSEGGADTLASATSGDAISSTDTGSCVNPARGAEAYLVDVNSSGGTAEGGSTLTVATEYDCVDTGGDRQGGVIDTNYEQIADRDGWVDSDTLTLTALVDIATTNQAATDYTDTWQVIGAGDF